MAVSKNLPAEDSAHVEFEKEWLIIQNQLKTLYCFSTSSSTVQNKICGIEVYTKIFILCNQKPLPFDDFLYQSLCQFLENKASESCRRIFMSENSALLETYCAEWKIYNKAAYSIERLFYYLNRIVENANQKMELAEKRFTISKLCINKWHTCVIEKGIETFGNRLVFQGLFPAIDAERDHFKLKNYTPATYAPNYFIQSAIESFVLCDFDLGLYKAYLEEPAKKNISEYYHKQLTWIPDTQPVSQFLQLANVWIEQEQTIIQTYFSASTYESLLIECTKLLAEFRFNSLLDSFPDLLRSENISELSACFRLFSKAEAHFSAFLDKYKEYFECYGRNAIQAMQAKSLSLEDFSRGIFEMFADLKLKAFYLQTQAFCDNLNFEKQLEKFMKSLVNDRYEFNDSVESKFLLNISQLSIHYLNSSSLKKASYPISSKEISIFFDMFKFVEDKDAVIRLFTISMAENILSDPSQRGHIKFYEECLARFRSIGGIDFVAKPSRVLSDAILFETINSAFSKSFHSPIDFYSAVITFGMWPIEKANGLNDLVKENLDFELSCILKKFDAFYCAKYHGRSLTWMNGLGYFTISLSTVGGNSVEIDVSFFHYLIIKLFEEDSRIKKKTFFKVLNLPHELLELCLCDLEKCKILSFNGSTETYEWAAHQLVVAPSVDLRPYPNLNRFLFDAGFSPVTESSSSQTIAIISLDSPSTFNFLASEDRKFVLQSLIVRLAKKHRQFTHSHLLNLVAEEFQTGSCKNRSIPPDNIAVKKTVEFLIDRQYLERDPLSADSYLYVV